MATANQFRLTLPGVGANVTNESPLVTLLRKRSYLDPMSQAIWDADPRNQAEIARLRREEAGLPPEAIPGTGTGVNLIPNTPPPGGWKDTNTYDDVFGTPPPPTPPAAPQRSGTVPGSVWNNPDSAAPRGYNPELWAQREIGPNRTSAGVGGPKNADGTAMYTPPPEYKPTRGIDPFGYEPAPRKQAEFSGFTIGDDGFYRSDRGGSDTAYDENLLRTLKAAADAGEGRANYILSALSTGADMARPVYSAQMNQYGANPIDNYAAQYDWEQEVLGKKEMQRKLKQGWTVDENRQLVPPSGWIEDGNGGWRPPLDDSSWTQVGNGNRWVRTENTSTKPEVPDMGKPDKESKNPFMNRMAKGTMKRRFSGPPSAPYREWATAALLNPKDQYVRDAYDDIQRAMQRPLTGKPVSRYPKGTMSMNPFSAAFAPPMPNPQQRVVPVGLPPMSPGMGRPPVMTMPSQNFPMDPQRRPVLIGQPHANPFLMGGANRVSGNPFRR